MNNNKTQGKQTKSKDSNDLRASAKTMSDCECTFLNTFYSEVQQAMRFRSEIEHKLLNVFIILGPALITASVATFELISDSILYAVFLFMIGLMNTFASFMINRKISAEHEIYESLGKISVKIWDIFNLFEKSILLEKQSLLNEKSRKYGSGDGYKKTQQIITLMAILLNCFLIIIGTIKFYA